MENNETFESKLSSLPSPVKGDISTSSVNHRGLPFCDHSSCKNFISDIQRDSDTILAGPLKKKKTLHQTLLRWTILTQSGHFIYYESQKQVGVKLPCGLLHLGDGVSIQGSDSSQSAFVLIASDGKSLRFEAQDSSEKEEWIDAINRFISPTDSSLETRGGSRFCSQCRALIPLDTFTLGDHVGFLTKQGGSIKSWKRRWCVLKDGHLAYYTSQNDVMLHAPKRILHVEGNNVYSSSSTTNQKLKHKHVWQIETDTRTFYFSALSSEEKDEWISETRMSRKQ